LLEDVEIDWVTSLVELPDMQRKESVIYAAIHPERKSSKMLV